MTIHHDKLAYGKLASSREDVSEERLQKMLAELNGEKKNTEEKSEREEKSPDPSENKKDGE